MAQRSEQPNKACSWAHVEAAVDCSAMALSHHDVITDLSYTIDLYLMPFTVQAASEERQSFTCKSSH